MEITILGAGAWGTALAICFSRQNHNVTLVTISKEHLQELEANHENFKYLPGYEIPNTVRFSLNIPENTKILFSCAPAQLILNVVERLRNELSSDKVPLIFCSKGIVLDDTDKYFLTEIASDFIRNPLFALSGPNFAHEIAYGLPSATVLASHDYALAKDLALKLTSHDLKILPCKDPIGIQIAGSIKNVFAIANGILVGKKLGQNISAALITQGIFEMNLLGKKMKANPETFSGLAGVSDLVLTCSSKSSRNMALGFALGQGQKLDEYMESAEAVIEGIATTEAIHVIKGKNLKLPVCDFIYSILYEGKSVDNALNILFNDTDFLKE